MPKSKKKYLPWPWRFRALYLVLGVSLIINAITLSFITYLNSPDSDMHVYAHTINQLCQRDYATNMAQAGSADTRALFSERICGRDAVSGELITPKIVDGHFFLR